MPRGVSIYDEAQLQGRLWTPAALGPAVIAAWADMGDMSKDTVASGLITQVLDKSGNGNTFTATTGPTYQPAGFRMQSGYAQPLSAGYSGGGVPRLSLTTGLSYNATTGGSVASIAEQNVNATSRTITGGATGALQLRYDGGNTLTMNRRGQVALATSTATAQAGLNVCGCDFATNASSVWLNGGQTSSTTNPSFTQPTLYVFDASGESFTGVIGEIIFFNRVLRPQERNAVDGYLAWRWGIQSRLIASQPYKNRPPLIGG